MATRRARTVPSRPEFAVERLKRDHRTDLVRARHADWCLTLAEQAEPFVWGAQDPAWLERLEAEHQNFQAALIWARDSARVDLALRLVIALGGFWETRGHAQEGDRWLTELLPAAETQPKAVRARALWWAGNFASRRDLDKASTSLETCLALFRELGETEWIGRTLLLLGNVANLRGQMKEARSLYEEAVAAARLGGDRSCIALAVGNLGYLLLQEGDANSAKPLVKESLGLFEELGEKEGAAVALGNLGFAAAEQRVVDEAELCFRRALRLALAIGFNDGIVCALEGMAKIATKKEVGRAARLLGAAMSLLEATDASLAPLEEAEHHHTSAIARASLGDERFDALITSGMHMALEEAVAYALEGKVVELSSPHRF